MAELLSRADQAHVLRLAGSQPESGAELTEFLGRLRDRVVAAALDDGRLRERLQGCRYRVLAADYREDKLVGGRVRRKAEVGVYDYDRDVLVIAVVDLRTGEVEEVLDRDGAQPPISEEELDEARSLAECFSPGCEAVAFPAPSYAFDALPDARSHRGCVLYGTSVDGDESSVVVDLTARRLVADEDLPHILRDARSGPSSQHEED